MSIYEMVDYDDLQRRIGLAPTPGSPWSWHCGNYPADEMVLDQPDTPFDELATYNGYRPKIVGGFCLSEDININGLLLNHRDLNNTIWLCTGIEGWWTLPPSEISDVPKPYWDGSMLTTGRYLSRIITITGMFIPPDPSLVWYNRDALLRVSSIVRGIGLLAMCGNENPDINQIETPNDPFYDPPKMTIIQANDVPLINTIKPNGTTEFSLSFRCVNPAKLSVYEKNAGLKIESSAVVRERNYRAFALGVGEGGGLTTEYRELLEIAGSADLRHYHDIHNVNLDYPIEDEEMFTSGKLDDANYRSSASSQAVTLYNAGNYFAFPTFVFDQIKPTVVGGPVSVTVRNLTTGESMLIQKEVAAGHKLVIDTAMRRVGEVDPRGTATSWKFDDRNYLTLTSEWITLAPGNNTLIASMPSGTTVPLVPQIYWRDTWIG